MTPTPPNLKPIARRLALLGLSALPGCVTVDEGTYVYDGVEGVHVDLSNGDVTILAEDRDDVQLDVDFGGLSRGERLGHTVVDGVLVIELDCGLTCGGDITARVPLGTWVEVQLDAGDLTLDGLDADITAELGSGDLAATGLLAGQACLSLDAGDLSAAWDEVPDEVQATAAMGSVDLAVPAGGYALDLAAGAGSITLDGVWDDPEADAAIAASVGAGDLTIRGL